MSPSNIEIIEGDFDDFDPIEFLGKLDAAVKRTQNGEGTKVNDIEEFIESL